MRVLIVTPPLTGHVAPLRAVAAALAESGHEVAWCGPEPATSALSGAQLVFPAGPSEPFDVGRRPADLRGFAALRFLWQSYLIPLADAMVPGVRTACERFGPDLVLADQQAFAGPLAAKALGIRWVTSASTGTELADPLRPWPKVADWVRQLQHDLCGRYGVAPADLRFSPDRVLAFTIPELTGPVSVPAVHYLGSAVTPSTMDLSWSALDGRPLVVATLGTSNTGTRFLGECVEALSAMPEVQGVVVDPTGTLHSEDVLVVARIPQIALLRKTSALICHAGHNTVCESLAAGVPLVLAPIRDDQHTIARSVLAAGAGVRLRFDRAAAEHIGRAVGKVLATPAHTAAARRLGRSLTSAGGARAAVGHLEALERRGWPCAPTPTRR
ncbi:MAG TPA: glycosyltransferase [Kutzneria sp.]|jgi:UDP:flavonoid glycosyltransferase YjiC (YdhE family)